MRLLIICLVMVLSGNLPAQKQLLILKRERVLLRLNAGDQIVFKLKGDKQIKRSYVNNLYDTALKVHIDTIPFHKIERIYFKQTRFINTLGGVLVTAGVGYFLIDQINHTLVDGNAVRLDPKVTRSASIVAGIGLPMMLFRKNSQKIRYPVRLLVAKKGSPFYRPPRNEGMLIPEN